MFCYSKSFDNDKRYLSFSFGGSLSTFKFGLDWNIENRLADVDLFLGFFTIGFFYLKTDEEITTNGNKRQQKIKK